MMSRGLEATLYMGVVKAPVSNYTQSALRADSKRGSSGAFSTALYQG
jgi:hypothetical protein